PSFKKSPAKTIGKRRDSDVPINCAGTTPRERLAASLGHSLGANESTGPLQVPKVGNFAKLGRLIRCGTGERSCASGRSLSLAWSLYPLSFLPVPRPGRDSARAWYWAQSRVGCSAAFDIHQDTTTAGLQYRHMRG